LPSAQTARRTLDLPSSPDRYSVRRLGPADSPAILDHFRRLDAEASYHRFFGAVSDHALSAYVGGFDWSRQIVLGAERDGCLCALSEIGWSGTPEGSSGEFAVSVDAAARHLGIAGWLLDAVSAAAAAEGLRTLEGNWLAENYPVYRLMRRRGAAIRQSGSTMTGLIALSPSGALATQA